MLVLKLSRVNETGPGRGSVSESVGLFLNGQRKSGHWCAIQYLQLCQLRMYIGLDTAFRASFLHTWDMSDTNNSRTCCNHITNYIQIVCLSGTPKIRFWVLFVQRIAYGFINSIGHVKTIISLSLHLCHWSFHDIGSTPCYILIKEVGVWMTLCHFLQECRWCSHRAVEVCPSEYNLWWEIFPFPYYTHCLTLSYTCGIITRTMFTPSNTQSHSSENWLRTNLHWFTQVVAYCDTVVSPVHY